MARRKQMRRSQSVSPSHMLSSPASAAGLPSPASTPTAAARLHASALPGAPAAEVTSPTSSAAGLPPSSSAAARNSPCSVTDLGLPRFSSSASPTAVGQTTLVSTTAATDSIPLQHTVAGTSGTPLHPASASASLPDSFPQSVLSATDMQTTASTLGLPTTAKARHSTQQNADPYSAATDNQVSAASHPVAHQQQGITSRTAALLTSAARPHPKTAFATPGSHRSIVEPHRALPQSPDARVLASYRLLDSLDQDSDG